VLTKVDAAEADAPAGLATSQPSQPAVTHHVERDVRWAYLQVVREDLAERHWRVQLRHDHDVTFVDPELARRAVREAGGRHRDDAPGGAAVKPLP